MLYSPGTAVILSGVEGSTAQPAPRTQHDALRRVWAPLSSLRRSLSRHFTLRLRSVWQWQGSAWQRRDSAWQQAFALRCREVVAGPGRSGAGLCIFRWFIWRSYERFCKQEKLVVWILNLNRSHSMLQKTKKDRSPGLS